MVGVNVTLAFSFGPENCELPVSPSFDKPGGLPVWYAFNVWIGI
jgi:hypothetical protein